MAVCKIETILVILIGIFSVVDTKLFVYPSLSYSLVTGVLVSLLAIITMFRQYQQKYILHPLITGLVLSWLLYILFFSTIKNGETYRLVYIINTLVFLVTIAINLKCKAINWKHIENVIIGLGIFNSVYVILQLIGVASSANHLILITGYNENPNSTAMYLVGALVVTFNRLSERLNIRVNVILAFLFILSIFLLKCRTALLGSLIVILVYLYKIFKTKISSRKYKIIGIVIIIVASTFVISIILLTKKNSSQGRLFVWKNSIELIKKDPMGYGYGLFEKTYNISQSNYFESGAGTEEEIRNADHVAMSYNDYLEMGIEGGIIGSLFLALLFILSSIEAYRQKDAEAFSFIIATMVMAMVNFLYSSVSVWLLVLFMIAKIMANYKAELYNKNHDLREILYRCIPLTIGIFSIVWGMKTVKMTSAQIEFAKLHQMISQNKLVYAGQLLKLQHNIDTSEAFYTDLGINYINLGEFQNAINALNMALRYSSSPSIYYNLWSLYMKQGQYQLGSRSLKVVENMEPIRILPKYYILNSYFYAQNMTMAEGYAKKILKTKVKIKNKESDQIIKKTQEILCEIHKSK